MKPKIKVILKHNGLRNYQIEQIRHAVVLRVPADERTHQTVEVRQGESIPEFAAQALIESYNTHDVTIK